MSRINEKVGAWLLKKGNNKTELAKSLGISTVTLDKKLSRETDWSWGQVIAITKLLDCTPNDLCDDSIVGEVA